MKPFGFMKWFNRRSAAFGNQRSRTEIQHTDAGSAYRAGHLLAPLTIRYDAVAIPEAVRHWQHACRPSAHRDAGAEYFQTLAKNADIEFQESLQWAAMSLYLDGLDDALNRLASEAQLWLSSNARNPDVRSYSRFMGQMYPSMAVRQTVPEEQARTESPAWMRDDWLLMDMAKASLEDERLARLNDLLMSKGLATLCLEPARQGNQPALDRLTGVRADLQARHTAKGVAPLVSIIVPVYNAHDTVETSIRSLLAQTWDRLEIIAVDDTSTDESLQMLERLAREDTRIRVLQSPVNRGAYPARNLGLSHAQGVFVTIADSDDWHHPEKIEMQVKCLMTNPGLIASMSGGFRATDSLHPVARSRPYYKQANLSSLLFDREKVLDSLGGWNSVRFGADTEFFNRMVMVFGPGAIHTIDLPLFVGRFREDSLTNDPLHGYVGHDLGARKEYVACYRHFQRQARGAMLRYPLEADSELPFPVPNLAKPTRDGAPPINLVYAGDFQDGRQATWAILQHQSARTKGRCPRLMHLPSFRPQASDEVCGYLRDYLFKHAETLVTIGESLSSAEVISHADTLDQAEHCSLRKADEIQHDAKHDGPHDKHQHTPMEGTVNTEPFDLQTLYDLWSDLPDAFRLKHLDLKMKLANIRQSWLAEWCQQQAYSEEDIVLMASQCGTTRTYAPFQACQQPDTNEAWIATLEQLRRDESDRDGNARREMLLRALQDRGEYRLHALLVNLARNDEEWLVHMNAYLGAIGAPQVSLRHEPGVDRTLRIASAAASTHHIDTGPLVSVIMPCFNAEEHLRWAAGSILQQTWRNIELIAVDDCSTDRTPDILRELAASDPRVRLLRTPFNAGPYVAKNLGVEIARGQFITGHDADDWALPQRIEEQLFQQIALGQPVSVGHMIRMSTDGKLKRFLEPSDYYADGILAKASISALFDADFFRSRMGSWDNVRYGADSELLARAAVVVGHEVSFANVLTMICLNRDDSLTNRPESAIIDGELRGTRLAYRDAWRSWHASLLPNETYLPVNQGRRFFNAPVAMQNKMK